MHCSVASNVVKYRAELLYDRQDAHLLVSHLFVVALHADAPEMAELGLIAPLGNILSQLSQGGGAKGINIDAVSPLPFLHA